MLTLSEQLKKKTDTEEGTYFNQKGYSRGAIAKQAGFSYSYTCNMLNGAQAMTASAKAKFKAIIDQLESEAGR